MNLRPDEMVRAPDPGLAGLFARLGSRPACTCGPCWQTVPWGQVQCAACRCVGGTPSVPRPGISVGAANRLSTLKGDSGIVGARTTAGHGLGQLETLLPALVGGGAGGVAAGGGGGGGSANLFSGGGDPYGINTSITTGHKVFQTWLDYKDSRKRAHQDERAAIMDRQHEINMAAIASQQASMTYREVGTLALKVGLVGLAGFAAWKLL